MRKINQKGFTLIEMIVSLAVFSFVITIAVGALLMLVAANRQLEGGQSVMTNLSFALDAMTREIRTGTFYYCDSQGSLNGSNNIFNPENNIDAILGDSYKDCSNVRSIFNHYHGIAFKEAGDSISGASGDRILYYFDPDQGKIFRRVGAGAPASIVADGVFLRNVNFIVTGSKKSSIGGGNSTDQPSVTIFIEAAEKNDPSFKSYYIQTTVTQRILDL